MNCVIFPGIHNMSNGKRLFGCLASLDGPLLHCHRPLDTSATFQTEQYLH